ncbi:stalk domain-containing protein [Flavonifractor sp. An9]|uniref:stalk domain-containing protein n=1 Tax=Flavonifractor sp. An9 TaxID=1965664 RepID=UPI000B379F35|nr:stalk domain-containing protein [Flavonifractor sp. An9]OUN11004.1 hypothetical protein B5G40_08405 [Flavonifractor sp. An9]
MNKKRPVIPFLSGVLATVLTMGCVTTALAASGLVQFSPVGLQLNGKAIFAAGDSVNTESGQSVPSSIVYTDEAGGGTTYLPLRTIANLLDVPITWDGAETTVVLGRGDRGGITVEPGTGESAWDSLPLHQAGKTAGPFAEVQPDARKGGIMLLEETQFRSGSDFSRDIPFVGANGRYVSITVTNNGTQPLLFQAGHLYATGRDMLATQIPAGATVTRTFEALESSAAIQPRFGVDISTGSGEGGTVDIQISAVQFNG